MRRSCSKRWPGMTRATPRLRRSRRRPTKPARERARPAADRRPARVLPGRHATGGRLPRCAPRSRCSSRSAPASRPSPCHTREYAIATYYLIATAEASSNLARYDGITLRAGAPPARTSLLDTYRRTRDAGFGAEVKRRIMLGTYALSAGYYDAYYLKAQKVRTLIRQDFEDAFAALRPDRHADRADHRLSDRREDQRSAADVPLGHLHDLGQPRRACRRCRCRAASTARGCRSGCRSSAGRSAKACSSRVRLRAGNRMAQAKLRAEAQWRS